MSDVPELSYIYPHTWYKYAGLSNVLARDAKFIDSETDGESERERERTIKPHGARL